MTYEVWAADLNSLYDDLPRSPVLVEVVDSLHSAQKLKKELKDHETAAWVRRARK